MRFDGRLMSWDSCALVKARLANDDNGIKLYLPRQSRARIEGRMLNPSLSIGAIAIVHESIPEQSDGGAVSVRDERGFAQFVHDLADGFVFGGGGNLEGGRDGFVVGPLGKQLQDRELPGVEGAEADNFALGGSVSRRGRRGAV